MYVHMCLRVCNEVCVRVYYMEYMMCIGGMI